MPPQPLIRSVNDDVDSDEFPTAWGTFDSVSELLLSLPPGCRAATFDIASAYRITPIRPDQQNSLCVYWNGKVHVDRALCFGLASSAGVFGAIADMLVDIYDALGFGPIRKWVDDFLVVLLPHQSFTESDFMAATAALGVPWSIPKTRKFAVCQRFTGFDWDLARLTVSMPEEKLAATRALVQAWLVPDSRVRMREAAALHGKLVHTSTIFPLIRPFLRSVSRFASSFRSSRASLRIPRSVGSDLAWIDDLLGRLPNTLPISRQEATDIGWWGDASSSFRVGVVVGPFSADDVGIL